MKWYGWVLIGLVVLLVWRAGVLTPILDANPRGAVAGVALDLDPLPDVLHPVGLGDPRFARIVAPDFRGLVPTGSRTSRIVTVDDDGPSFDSSTLGPGTRAIGPCAKYGLRRGQRVNVPGGTITCM